jgi:hypothetical protein
MLDNEQVCLAADRLHGDIAALVMTSMNVRLSSRCAFNTGLYELRGSFGAPIKKSSGRLR